MGFKLDYSVRQMDSEFSRLSERSRRKLNFLKLITFLAVAGLSLLVYYLRLLPPSYHEMLSFFLIMSISCNLIPVPTYAFVLYISHDYALWLIVLVASLGATISALFEYNVVNFIMRFDRIAKLKETKKYQRFASYFDRYSFSSILVASSLPLPVDFIRIMAITRRYPKFKFLAATMLGRIPRFTLIALMGFQLSHPKRIAVSLVGMTLLFELVRRLRKIFQRIPAAQRSA